MWQAARAAEACGPGCPVCGKGMRVIVAGKAGVEVDVCVGCQMLWLDAGEQEKLGVAPVVGAVVVGAPVTVERAAAERAATVLLAEAGVAGDAEAHRRKRAVERRSWWIWALVDALVWWSV